MAESVLQFGLVMGLLIVTGRTDQDLRLRPVFLDGSEQFSFKFKA
jgi:hypothetical protein